ncbi:hypothetical protein TIFTF001_021611 [Ficus carica]|uniref:Uncharacterized protein n=1 Tax=Ficus carica TaxID=3494 RepID=A0AA88AV18_FICCA|nr:hypothetical protein TIFTF001_021611 [Ficus carica]
MRAGLRDGGEGVGSMRGPALLVVGGVCPSSAVSLPSLLLTFFTRWSDRVDGCSGVDERGFVGDLAFASSVVGVFLRVWDKGSLWLLLTCRLAYSEFCSVGLSICWYLSLVF